MGATDGSWGARRRFLVLPVISSALVIVVVIVVAAVVLSQLEEDQHRGGPLRNPEPLPRPDPIGTVAGVTTFRGNASRTFLGQGPVPLDPVIGWRIPPERMCSDSFVGIERRRWCGTGW